MPANEPPFISADEVTAHAIAEMGRAVGASRQELPPSTADYLHAAWINLLQALNDE